MSDHRRATFWQFNIYRYFEHLLNSCFVRITSFHLDLLDAWHKLVYSQEFQKIQSLPFEQRPSYLFGDQDLLEGLLMSDNFSHIPVKLIRHGYEIIHASNSYSIRDRVSFVIHQWKTGEVPMLLHAHGLKPWMLIHRKANSFKLSDVAVELSPYITAAKSYRKLLESDTSWMDSRTWLGSLCVLLTFRNPHIQGIPIILLEKFKRLFVKHCYLKPVLIKKQP
jgi:hypothetical protein